MYLAPAVLIVGMVIHAIRFKVNIMKGKFLLGIGLLSIAMIVSTIVNTEIYDINTLLVFVMAIFFVMLYGFFANTIQGDNLLYLIRILAILGLLISAEVFVYYLQIYLNDGAAAVHDALQNKQIDLGWGISNFIATYLIMFISATTYFIKKYKLHIFWIVLALFEIAMLLFTLSRAGIIAFIGTSVFLVLFMFIKYDHKLSLLLNIFLGALVFAGIVYFTKDYFVTVLERLQLLKLDDTGRIEIWEEAVVIIKANPIFGKGLFARNTAVGENELRMFHNTILHTLATLGVLGGISLVVQFGSILRIFLYKFNQKKAILLIALIGANIHGMVDNIYFMPQYMIIMFIIIAVVENAGKIDQIREDLRVN
jgi:O-antigen ligase